MRWQLMFIGIVILVLIGVASWQYAPEAKERAAIRETVTQYLSKIWYFNPQVQDIRIAHNYAVATVYAMETLVLFLRKSKGKWEVVTHGNLLTRETIRMKVKVPEDVLEKLRIPKAGSFGGD